MRLLLPSLAVCGLLTALPAVAAPASTTVWPRINQTTRLSDRLFDNDFHDYQLQLQQGQRLSLRLDAAPRGTYFELHSPQGKLLFNGPAGSGFHGFIPDSGSYTVHVYVLPGAARRGESSRYTLQARVLGDTFDEPRRDHLRRTLAWQGIRFMLDCDCEGSIGSWQLAVEGLLQPMQPLQGSVDGTITDVRVADLNGDGKPELYLFTRSAGSGSYGNVLVFVVDEWNRLNSISLPPPDDYPDAMAGYMGHDEFTLSGQRLLRRFPLYRDGDGNAMPTGGMRQLSYRLERGPGGWRLQLERPFGN
ncbi:PliI family lysozyme inhibitor of I-type lysozyme [Vogesella sp. LIG4]|uniref:PliI family lysozyme inhibitor of I-type lysozyme n=1 Tax=Vogesella sp. LIG4 TaxID=1192162 RepID=UPI00082009D6|nr:PliI family lysozyme inhibitor of I-type lysozyme [Vogesella sp. LIG4]SCK23625.1 lysozyme inhibitor of I-type lysozyme [Vogesella sp. LIG4]